METDNLTPKQRYRRRLAALKGERTTWDPHWRELSAYLRPRSSRFLSTDINRGGEKNDEIINATGTWALRVLSSGMMAGITSPSREWFRLTTPDPELAETSAVKEWLYTTEQRIRLAFQRSNIYNALHTVYQDLALYGTAVLHVEEDFDDGVRNYVYPAGSYSLANSSKLRVDTCYREFGMTVAQLVEEFGQEKCSEQVKAAWRNGQYDTWIQVVHVLQPNKQRVGGRIGREGMAYESCYFERDNADELILREEGYAEMPTMCPRWTVTGEDVYGNSPAMECLGDVRALQELERRAGLAYDKLVNPPMRVPGDMMGQAVSLLPGAYNYVDHVNPGQAFAPAIEIRPESITVAENKIRQHEMRVKQGLYADLFLMLANDTAGQMTAREVAERHEEKMLQLGPVMERLQDELLDPLIRRTFSVLWRQHYLPEPPKELQGANLRVEYISTMAQAQRMIGSGGVRDVASFVGNLAGVNKDVLDKLDFDQMVDEYASMLGVPPRIIRSDEQVKALRGQRAQAMAAQQQAQIAMQQAQGAKLLSETSMEGDTALTRAAAQFGPGVQ